MKNVKIIRVTRGQELIAAQTVADYYNRQGAIGNVTSRAIITTAGDDVVYTIFSDGKVDDGRQVDTIESRKRVLIVRAEKGKEAEAEAAVAEFYNQQTEDGARTSRSIITPVGEDIVFTVFADKFPEYDDDQDDDFDADDLNDDDDFNDDDDEIDSESDEEVDDDYDFLS